MKHVFVITAAAKRNTYATINPRFTPFYAFPLFT